MSEIEIRLVRNGRALKTRGVGHQRVPANSIVTFTVDQGITPTMIAFEGQSPFGAAIVKYNTPLAVTAAFNASGNNVYAFRCHGRAGNEELDSKDGGGEIEIVPGG